MSEQDWFSKDFYKVLGVDKTADKKAITKAYRKLARKWHPDQNPGDKTAEAKFKEIGEAYAVLSNDEDRKRYDAMSALLRRIGRHGRLRGPLRWLQRRRFWRRRP